MMVVILRLLRVAGRPAGAKEFSHAAGCAVARLRFRFGSAFGGSHKEIKTKVCS